MHLTLHAYVHFEFHDFARIFTRLDGRHARERPRCVQVDRARKATHPPARDSLDTHARRESDCAESTTSLYISSSLPLPD